MTNTNEQGDLQGPQVIRRRAAKRLLRASFVLFTVAIVLLMPLLLLNAGFWSKYVATGAVLSGGLGITCLLNGAWDYWSSR